VAAYVDKHPEFPNLEFFYSGPMYMLWPLAFALACAGCVLFIQPFEARWAPFLRRSGLAYLGLISYSVYLFHPFVIDALGGGWNAEAPQISPWWLVPAGIVLTLVLSTITYWAVERPGMRMGRELRRPELRDLPARRRLAAAARRTFGAPG
jgi:peptidoglycan/LPS O-acetylase OafA/YrhL